MYESIFFWSSCVYVVVEHLAELSAVGGGVDLSAGCSSSPSGQVHPVTVVTGSLRATPTHLHVCRQRGTCECVCVCVCVTLREAHGVKQQPPVVNTTSTYCHLTSLCLISYINTHTHTHTTPRTHAHTHTHTHTSARLTRQMRERVNTERLLGRIHILKNNISVFPPLK